MWLPDLVVRGQRVVTLSGARPAAVHVRKGRIIGVVDFDDLPPGCPVDDAGEHTILPGLVDTHVHVHEPGRAMSDAFERTTQSAASGGVTTIVAMPFDSGAPTTTVAALELKRHAAQGRCFVDVGFWGGVVPGNQSALAPLFEAGVFGFSCTLASADGDTAAVSADALRAAMPALARLGAPLLAQANLSGRISPAVAEQRTPRAWLDRLRGLFLTGRHYADYLDSCPKAAENDAIAVLIQLCQEYRLPTHVVRLSSSDALTPIFHARSKQLPITAETCPHYLTFVAEEIPNGAVEYKCSPPIRERTNREFLWAALAGGLIQSVASDHQLPAGVGSPPRNFLEGTGGIASIQLGLSIVWTEARAREYTLEQVAQWMCYAPARRLGLARKGSIDVGYDADLVVFDQDAEFTIDPVEPRGRRPMTPYRGRRLRGVVKRTYLRGARVYDDGGASTLATGRLVLRDQRS